MRYAAYLNFDLPKGLELCIIIQHLGVNLPVLDIE